MIDFNSLQYVASIARHGSFTKAAEEWKIPNSNLSHKIKLLEEELGQALFIRTTRQVRITDFGSQVLEIIDPLSSIRSKLHNLIETEAKEPTGVIRVNVAIDLGLYIIRYVLPNFFRDYPKIKVEFAFTHEYVDIISEACDFAIRATSKGLKDSAEIALKLGSTPINIYAAADGPFAKIKSVNQLGSAPILSLGSEVTLTKSDKKKTFPVSKQIQLHDMGGIKQAVLGNLGIGTLPEIFTQQPEDSALLKQLVPEYTAGEASFYAIFPSKNSLTKKNRSLVESLQKQFA